MKLNLSAKVKDILLPLFFLTIFVSVVLINAPLKETFEYNPDEGIHLMESLLFLKGFPLRFGEHPLLIVILSYWFKLFGPSVYYGRILILIFSSILLWAFYQTIKSLWGHFCASVAVLFLVLSTEYAFQSVSIMIGLPALCFAMLSILCVTLYRKSQSKYLLVLSGIFMALSLQTKLFTVFLMPVIVLEIVQVKWRKGLLLWFGSFLIIYLAIIVIFFHFNFSMFIQRLIKPHYVARAVFNIPSYGFLKMLRMIFNDYGIVLLALSGMILLIREKKWQFLFPVLWLILAFLVLLYHRPIWYSHYLLLSIPISWLAAISFSEFFVEIRDKWFPKINMHSKLNIFFRWLIAGIIILTILRLPVKYNRMCKSLWGETAPEERRVVELMLKYKKRTRWIITDRPIFAFYTKILTPPKLGFPSIKKRLIKKKSPHYFIYVLQKYKPEQILLARFQNYHPKIIFYIEKNYFKIHHCKLRKRKWLLPSLRWRPKHKRFANRIWSYKIPVIQGYRCKTTDKEIKLYIRKDIIESEDMPTSLRSPLLTLEIK